MHFLIVVIGVEIDGSEEVKDFQLFALADVFVEGGGYGILACL
jgi:hypothetical protein